MGRHSLKAVSTALATIAIIFVLVMSMVWMGYMLALNAQQQARAAGQAETIALKAKELVRVFIWLDPARQGNTYLNLTRISFVNEWSGETMINSLLIVYRDQPPEVRQVSIKLAAGEEKTYLPSELGLTGLDNYQAALSRLRYIQAHTTLGNDFVSLWGRPDKPAIYVTGTTRTNTYTVTTTTTSVTITNTTRTTTTFTTTVWTNTSIGAEPVLRVGYVCDDGYFTFYPNGIYTPYQLYGYYYGSDGQWHLAEYFQYSYERSFGMIVGYSVWDPFLQDYVFFINWVVFVVDAKGNVFRWSESMNGVVCGGGGGGGGGDNPGTSTTTVVTTGSGGPGSTTQQPGTTTYTMTETVTQTTFLSAGSTVTVTVTGTTTSYVTVTSTITSTYVGNTYVTITTSILCTVIVQNTLNIYMIAPTYVSVSLPCYKDIRDYPVPVYTIEQSVEGRDDVRGAPVYSLVLLGLLLSPELMQRNRRKKLWITLALVLSAATLYTANVNSAQAQVYYTTVTVTTTVTYSYTDTYTYTYTHWITYTGTWTSYTVSWTYSTITVTSTVGTCSSTTTINNNVCTCGEPPGCVFNCPWPQQ